MEHEKNTKHSKLPRASYSSIIVFICGLLGTGECQPAVTPLKGTSTADDPSHCLWYPVSTQTMLRKRFLLLGDSLTQQSFDSGGWGARLTSTYQRKADVTLRGYSGYNTRWALHIMEEILPNSIHSPRYDFATLWFGANDAALPDRCNARQHVPITEYEDNLNAFISRLESLGAQVVVITPPPVDEGRRIEVAKQWDPPAGGEGPERSLEMSGKYANSAKKVARARHLPVLDLWTELQAVPEWQSLLSDGLHFAKEGNDAVFRLLMQLIETELPHFRAEDLLTDFPLNTEINADQLAASFRAHARTQQKRAS